MAKRVKDNTPEEIPTKTHDWEDYLNSNSLQMEPANGAFKKRLAHQMIEWAKTNHDVYSLDEFLVEVGLNDKTLAKWRKDCIELDEATDTTKRILGVRRERAAIKRDSNTNPETLRIVMPHYSSVWRETIAWRSSLSDKESDKEGGTKIIIMEKYGEQREEV